MFFDFECTQDDGQHIQISAWSRMKAETRKYSWAPTPETNSASGSSPEKMPTFIAHNFQAYDGYFILQHLYKNGIVLEVINRGAKILSLTVPQLNIEFIDSLCFIPMRLANFPKTFGILELEKCFFPHFFNRAENQDYMGPLPNAMYYDPKSMSSDDREKFYAWYNDLVNQDYVFDFQTEILRYCQSDVDILRRCCLEFRELFHSLTDVDPFAQCLTIASACNHVFRKTFQFARTRLQLFHRAVTPRKRSNRSSPSRCWPTLLNQTTSPSAMHGTMVNNVSENISSTVSMSKPTPCGRSKAVYGTDVQSVMLEIRSTP